MQGKPVNSDNILNEIKKENTNLKLWLEQARADYDTNKNKYCIGVPDSLHKKTLVEKYSDEILGILKECISSDVMLEIEVDKALSAKKRNVP